MLARVSDRQPIILSTRCASLAMLTESASELPVASLADQHPGVVHLNQQADHLRVLMTESACLDAQGRLNNPDDNHFAMLEIRGQHATLYRSMCGLYSLFYQQLRGQTLISSDEQCLLNCNDRRYTLNRHRIASHLGLENAEPGSTFFNEIRQAVPMYAVTLNPMQVRMKRFQWFHVDSQARTMNQNDAEQQLIRLMDESVERSMMSLNSSSGQIGLAVSGGMDSTAVAASLSRQTDKAVAYSWDFADFPAGNEHRYTDALRAHLGIATERVTIRQPEPLSDAFMAMKSPLQAPFIDPYRVLRHQLACRVLDDGMDTLMTGDFGDHLYLGQHYHLRDAWRARQPGIASVIRSRIKAHGLKGFRRQDSLRRLLPLNGCSRRFRQRHTAWLTPGANRLLFESRQREYLNALAEPDRFEACLSVNAADSALLGRQIHANWGINQHYPLRDPALIRFMLSLPAHYLTDPVTGQSKWLMRQAMQQRLPEQITQRVGKTSFASIFMHGIEQHRHRAEQILHADHACWPDYLEADWIESQLSHSRTVA